MLVLITGGRDYQNKAVVYAVLDRLSQNPDIDQIVVMHGAARGADSLAHQWCLDRGVEPLPMPADWNTYKRAAGPIRNREMLEAGPPDRVIAFPGGVGTENMVHQSHKRGIPVWRVTDTGSGYELALDRPDRGQGDERI
jgi:hypothetical protein